MKPEDIDKAQILMRGLQSATHSLAAVTGSTKRYEISIQVKDRSNGESPIVILDGVAKLPAVRAAIGGGIKDEIKAIKEKLKDLGVKL